jgi:hypothetical protein
MPGLDRRGPRGEGPLNGGRRGLCVEQTSTFHSVSLTVQAAAAVPGGGRGRAWGWGCPAAQVLTDSTTEFGAAYPVPDAPASSWLSALNCVLRRLNRLATSIADLHDRDTADSRPAEAGETNASRK